MKYQEILFKVIDEYKNRSEKCTEMILRDGLVLEDICFFPRMSPENRSRKLAERNIRLAPEEIKKTMRYFFMLNPHNRELAVAEAKKIQELLQAVLEGRLTDIKEYEAKREESLQTLREVHGNLQRSMYYLALVGFFRDERNRALFPQKQAWLRGISCMDARRMLDKLVKGVLQPSQVVNVNDLRAVVKETLDDGSSAEEETDAAVDPQEAKIQGLEFKLDHLRATLAYVEESLEELNQNVEKRAAAAKQAAIAEFFISMNSSRYGLLDKVMQVDQTLTKLRRDNVVIPAELKPLTIIVRRMTEFIKGFGFQELQPLGTVYETDAAGLEPVDYLGEPFFDDEEVKLVKVISSGWRYGDIVISKPVVQEVLEDMEDK